MTSDVVSEVLTSSADVFKSGVENLSENATFMERLMYGLKFAAIGITTVFMVLIILMAVLYVFKLFSKIQTSKKPAEKAAPEVPEAQATASDTSEETVVAAAMAAIAAYRGESDCAFKVISITKIS